MKIGIIGFGSIAKRVYLPLYLDNNGIEKIYVCGRDKTKLENNLKNYNLDITDDFKWMLDQIDVLMVHSATVSHFEYIKTAIKMRIPVYVDKPLTDDIEHSTELIELSKKHNSLLFVGYNRRYAPLYTKLKAMNLDIGRIHYEKHRADLTYDETYEFAIIDEFIHLIDTVIDFSTDDLSLKNAIIKTSKAGELVSLYTDYSNKDTAISLFTARNSGSDYEKVTIDAKDHLVTIDNMRILTILKDNKTEVVKINERLSDSQIRGFELALENFFESAKDNKYVDLKQMNSELLCDDIIKSLKK